MQNDMRDMQRMARMAGIPNAFGLPSPQYKSYSKREEPLVRGAKLSDRIRACLAKRPKKQGLLSMEELEFVMAATYSIPTRVISMDLVKEMYPRG